MTLPNIKQGFFEKYHKLVISINYNFLLQNAQFGKV